MGLHRPLELKLDLFFIVVELMLDGELGALRHSDPFARDLDPERLVFLQSVCETAKLGHYLLSRVDAFDISRTPGHGDPSLRSRSAHRDKRATPGGSLAIRQCVRPRHGWLLVS